MIYARENADTRERNKRLLERRDGYRKGKQEKADTDEKGSEVDSKENTTQITEEKPKYRFVVAEINTARMA